MTPAIVCDELSAISKAAASVDGLEVSGSFSARQVSATYLHDDCNLGVVITLAESHPLQIVEVRMANQLGVRIRQPYTCLPQIWVNCVGAGIRSQIPQDTAQYHQVAFAQGDSSALSDFFWARADLKRTPLSITGWQCSRCNFDVEKESR